MRRPIVLAACVLILQFCLPAAGATHYDSFYLALEGNVSNWNQVDPSLSGGSGYVYNGSPWIGYTVANPGDPVPMDPSGVGPAPTVPVWLNQWYYDDPFDPLRWKEVTVDFTYQLLNPDPVNPQPGGAVIVINYTQPGWPSNPNVPPLPGQDDPLIGRVQIADLWLAGGDGNVYAFQGTFDLRDFGIPFNPEWVSIDVSGYNILLSSPAVPGSFTHTCVPNPGSLAGGLALLGLAVTGGVIRQLRRRVA